MQTYIVVVSGSILNVSTVHLNGIWHLIWRSLLKPVLGGHPVLSRQYFSFPESIFIIKSGWLINLSHYILVSLPVWRVDISPFACNLLDSVTVVPFSRKHYTLPIIAFSFVFIYWKCLGENAGNGISEPLNLKHFLGSMSPYLPSLHLPRFGGPIFLSVRTPSKPHATPLLGAHFDRSKTVGV